MSESYPAGISVQSSVRKYAVNSRRVTAILKMVGALCGIAATQVNVLFVGPERIRTLNQRFRNKDRSTDVLSFPIKDWPGPVQILKTPKTPRKLDFPDPLGDIVISLSDAEKNARHIGQSLSREVCFLLIHGFLHLCGHDHIQAKDETAMLSAQRKLFLKLARRRPAVWAGLIAAKSSAKSSRKNKCVI